MIHCGSPPARRPSWLVISMARAEQVKALIRSHALSDHERFYAVALQVAAKAAKSGHDTYANELRTLVEKFRDQSASPIANQPIPVVKPRGELSGVLHADYPKIRLSTMSLDNEVSSQLKRVLREQRQRDRLREYSLQPMRKLLLAGPPGTGKTMTASALAGELHLPLFSVRLDGLLTKFMGETAAKLRLIFDAIAEHRGVYLFDEFDALGGQRHTGNDVGEIRRVVNSFLQFLEQDTSDSLIIAATNFPEILDHALFRRFDVYLDYTLPTPDLALKVLKNRLTFLDTQNIQWNALQDAVQGLSHAELTQACIQAAKDAILDSESSVSHQSLKAALQDRQRMRRLNVPS